jgi:hypothetical protein
MVLPNVISQREDSAPWITTTCQTMHRVAIAPITDRMPTKNARNVRCDVTGRPARCWMWCAGSHDLTSPLRTRASHRFHHNLNLSPQRTSPPGCTSVAPACRVYRHCARIQRYTPSPLHRLGARASSPHAGCTGIAPAYSDTLHHLCTAWVRGLPARMPGAQALRPHTAIHPITPAPPGCAGVSPACRVRGHRACFFSPGCASVAPACRERGRLTCFFSPGSAGVSPACRIRERLARMPGARAFRPHAAMRPIRGRDALIPRRVCSPRCEQLHNPVLLFHCRDRAILRSDPGRKNAHCCPNDHE